MNWIIIGKLADTLGILSFLISIGIFKKVNAHSKMQKETYSNERDELLCHLSALQQNIWIDGIISPKLQDQLESKILEYRIKYWMISNPSCLFHIQSALWILRKEISPDSNIKLRHHINYLMARLTKKE